MQIFRSLGAFPTVHGPAKLRGRAADLTHLLGEVLAVHSPVRLGGKGAKPSHQLTNRIAPRDDLDRCDKRRILH